MDEFSDIWIVLGAIPLYIILSLTITPVLRHRLNTLQKKQYGSKIQYLELKQQLTAPVNGHVQQLAIHTVGGVVTPA